MAVRYGKGNRSSLTKICAELPTYCRRGRSDRALLRRTVKSTEKGNGKSVSILAQSTGGRRDCRPVFDTLCLLSSFYYALTFPSVSIELDAAGPKDTSLPSDKVMALSASLTAAVR